MNIIEEIRKNSEAFLNKGNHCFVVYFSIEIGTIFVCNKCGYSLAVTQSGVFFYKDSQPPLGLMENLLFGDNFIMNCDECIIKDIVE